MKYYKILLSGWVYCRAEVCGVDGVLLQAGGLGSCFVLCWRFRFNSSCCFLLYFFLLDRIIPQDDQSLEWCLCVQFIQKSTNMFVCTIAPQTLMKPDCFFTLIAKNLEVLSSHTILTTSDSFYKISCFNPKFIMSKIFEAAIWNFRQLHFQLWRFWWILFSECVLHVRNIMCVFGQAMRKIPCSCNFMENTHTSQRTNRFMPSWWAISEMGAAELVLIMV